MKKSIVIIIAISMLCVSISGAGFSQNVKTNIINDTKTNQDDINQKIDNHLSTEQITTLLSNSVDHYLSATEEDFIPVKQKSQPVDLPWINKNNADLLEWWVRFEYKGQIYDKEVDISISDFTEKFLKHPEYGEILFFNIDDDPEDDVEVIIGFYWSVIKYPDRDDARSLEFRFRVRQLPDGGISDNTAELQVWSELRVNYGLIKNPVKSRSQRVNNIFDNSPILSNLISRLQNFRDNLKYKPLENFLGILFDKLDKKNDDRKIVLADNSDYDYISIGSGYRTTEGERIPNLVDKRFSFAKSFNYNWKEEGSLFNPTIFEHELYAATSPDPVELLYGFQAFEGSTDTKKLEIAFSVEFEPPVYLRTKYIPADGYVYYNFDHKSARYSPTDIIFTADVFVGQAIPVPRLILTLDKIESGDLAKSSSWFSFDINSIKGFKYEASERFNVGIRVDIPSVFEEKIEIKGLPTSVECEWGIDDLDFVILPKSFTASLDVYAKTVMNSHIDKITVFYPKTDLDAPDAPFLEIDHIPSSQRVSAGGTVSLSSGTYLDVSLSGHAGVSMSGGIKDLTVYYPKADQMNDPDMEFITIPQGIPRSISASASGHIKVNLNNIMDPNNYIYGSVSHTMSSNFEEIDIYAPLSFDPNAVDPIVRFTDIPSQVNSWGRLYWGKLQGEFHSARGSIGGWDPIEIDLEYGDYSVYNKLEIRDGFIDTRFHVATDGYLFLDTSKSMLGDILLFEDKAHNHKLEFQIDEVSAQNLYANWDISGSGSDLKVNDLDFNGIVDTLKNLELKIKYLGKNTQIDLDWQLGSQGGLVVDVYQDEETHIDFDLGKNIEGVDFNGYVTLPSNPHFDVIWKWHQGSTATDPGYFKINEYTNQVSIKDMYIYATYTDTWGARATLQNAAIYVCVEWYWYNLMLYIWPVIDFSGTLDFDLLLNGQWYDVLDYENPP